MTSQPKTAVLLPVLFAVMLGAMTLGAIVVFSQGADGADGRFLAIALAALAAVGLGWRLLARRRPSRPEAAEGYRRLVDAVSDFALVGFDGEGRIRIWNSGAERITGFPAAEMIGQAHSRLFIPSDQAAGKPQQLLDRVHRLGRIEDEGWRLRRDGSRFWASVVFTVMASPSAEGAQEGTAGFAAVIRDLSDWRRNQLDVQAATARLKLILDTAAEGIYGVDDENRVVFANRAAALLLGWSSAEAALGRDSAEMVGYLAAHGGFCSAEACSIRQTLIDGQTRSVADECFTRADGEPLPVEYVVAPLVVQDITVGAVVVFHDVAEKRQREQEIGRLLAFQQTILDAAGNAIIATDPSGTITLFNRAAERILGYPAAEMIGRATPEVFHDRAEMDRCRASLQTETGQPVAPGFDSLVAGARLRGGPDIDEWTYLRKDGSRVPVLLAVSVLKGADGVDGYLGVSQDISRLKTLERELKRSNAELEHFAYAASHDLRQPLRMIGSHLTLLQRHLKDDLDEEGREFIGFAVDGAKRMDRMIADLLDYSRIGRKTGSMEMVSLHEVAQRVLRNLEFLIEDSGARISLETTLPSLFGNPLELERLLQNLLSNAVKFRVDGRAPEIVVTSREHPQDWQLTVQDNGIGIDPQQQGRLFNIFQRLVSHERYEGTGIGLASCRKIVEHHGGRIWVESVPGEGSSFHVLLPKHLPAEMLAEPAGNAADTAVLAG